MSGFKFVDGSVVVYTDGCCLDNGRSNAKPGIGVYFGPNHVLNVSEPAFVNSECRATNINAEIQAATKAIEIIFGQGHFRAKIYTDSEFVVKCVNEWMSNWKSNGWLTKNNKPVVNKYALTFLDNAISKMQHVDWVYVPAHQKQEQVQTDEHAEGNKMADDLANKGALKYVPEK